MTKVNVYLNFPIGCQNKIKKEIYVSKQELECWEHRRKLLSSLVNKNITFSQVIRFYALSNLHELDTEIFRSKKEVILK